METYKDKLAPWERRNGYYQKVQLGQNIAAVKDVLKEQIIEMMKSRIATTNEMIANPMMNEDTILEFVYNLKSVGDGMYGLKAAFEWGISDVVWQLELRGSYLCDHKDALFRPFSPQVKKIFKDAVDAYEDGCVEESLEKFLELDSEVCFDFATHITIGIIYLFHEMSKERAGEYFNKALNYVRATSPYYTAYALLYKALIKRDYGHVEEAESCTREAIKLCPDFTEAIYQNAQYNALLNKSEIVIPLLKEVIQDDVIYCLKINGERDFDGIRTDINKMFEEIGEENKKDTVDRFEELNGKLSSFRENVNRINKLDYDLPKVFSVESLKGGIGEVGSMVSKNTIFDTYLAELSILQTATSLKKKEIALKKRCNGFINEIEVKIADLVRQLVEENKKNPFARFLLYFFLGQFVAVPVGVSFSFPVGIFAAEVILFTLCMILTLGRSRSTWKSVLALEEEKEKLVRIVYDIND
ncbi:MAG: hypothetical protein GY941_20780 [Planctomycetes bacterium]|nr:hypothetical protein [Planctomycetota bacterium]